MATPPPPWQSIRQAEWVGPGLTLSADGVLSLINPSGTTGTAGPTGATGPAGPTGPTG